MHRSRPAVVATGRSGPAIGLACALLTLLLSGCLPGAAPPGPAERSVGAPPSAARNSVPIRVGKAIRGDMSGVHTFTGEVRAKAYVAVVPRVAGRLEKLYVDVGSRVREGEPLADLERAELETRVLEAQAAQAAAEARLATLKSGARPEAVAQAQANLKAAQARVRALETARQSADPAALQQRVEQARARVTQAEEASQPNPHAVAQAEAALTTARNKLNQILGDPKRANDRQAVEEAREEIRRAEQAASAAKAGANTQAAAEAARRELQDAELALMLARLSFSAFDLDQARALVEAAEAQVRLVEAPASPDEIKAAEATVEQAFALAELARARLRDATVTAPIAGVVTEIHAAPGGTVGPTGAILTLIPRELQVVVQADEAQAAHMQVGQSVALSLESYPQDAFSGVVKAIAPVLDPRTRTVAVRVEVADPQAKLRPGMFAQLAIQSGGRQSAVLIPKEAVLRTQDVGGQSQHAVFLVVDNRLRRQRVVLGASDVRNVEVLQGITEGADVVLSPRTDFVEGETISGN